MNSRRRAELQRKLSMGAVPKPPAGLADRIKSDIPKYLTAATDRERFSSSIALNMRIAASVVLVITSVVVAFYLLAPEQQQDLATEIAHRRAESNPTAAKTAAGSTAETDEASATAEAAATPQELSDASAAPPAAPAAAPQREAAAPVLIAELPARETSADRDLRESRAERAAAPQQREIGGRAGGVVGGVIGSAASENRGSDSIVADAAAAPPAPPASMRATASSPTIVSDSVSNPAAAQEAFAAEPKMEMQPASILGVSVDPGAFERVRSAIERGSAPTSTSVDVEALINHFAGRPARAPRGVTLEVEASPAPVESEGNVAILRFTVDAPADAARDRDSIPAATDAHIEIAINDRVVNAIRPVGDGATAAAKSTIDYNTSVTRLYELDLRSRLYASERVVTVRLHYRTPSGRRRTIEHVIHARDLARNWERASRRQRLASLGALWAESLKGTNGGADVALRASELATENPDDPRARELAQISRASVQLRGGAGTGSGR